MALQPVAGKRPDEIAFYLEEYRKELKRLSHISGMIEQLEGESEGIYKDVQLNKNVADTAAAMSFQKSLPGEKKKRGRKSKWGSFIVHRLTQEDRPFTYENILEDAARVFGIETEEGLESAKKIIFSTSYRLKNKVGIIQTFAIKGRRGKFLALKSWCTSTGKLKKKYALMISSNTREVVAL